VWQCWERSWGWTSSRRDRKGPRGSVRAAPSPGRCTFRTGRSSTPPVYPLYVCYELYRSQKWITPQIAPNKHNIILMDATHNETQNEQNCICNSATAKDLVNKNMYMLEDICKINSSSRIYRLNPYFCINVKGDILSTSLQSLNLI